MEEQFDANLFRNLNPHFVLKMFVTNEQKFTFQIIEEEQINRTSIIEDLIPDNSFVSPLIIERENRTLINDRRISAEQEIILNNYHNIFELNTTLVNTSHIYFQQISKVMNEFQFSFKNPIVTIQSIFTILSQKG
jgi:hypothetical protein